MKILITTSGREIAEDHGVYSLKAGHEKLFLPSYLKENKVWLELPGFKFDSETDLDATRSLKPAAKARVHEARALAKYWLNNFDYGNPRQYKFTESGMVAETKSQTTISFADGQMFRTVERFFNMKKGDLVVVPGRGQSGNILVGSISSNRTSSTTFERWNNAEFTARTVEWLGVDRPRHKFSYDLSSIFSGRRAFHVLKKSFRREIYDYVYGNWSFEDKSNIALEVKPRDEERNEVNPASISTLNLMVLYYGYLYDCAKDGVIPKDYYTVLPELLIATNNSGEYVWEGSVHSPGEVIFRIYNPFKAAFIGAMLSLASQVADADITPQDLKNAEIATKNQWHVVPSECDVDVSDKVRKFLTHMNLDQYIENCQRQKDLLDKNLQVDGATKVDIEP